MDRGAWQSYSSWGHKELDTTEDARMPKCSLELRFIFIAEQCLQGGAAPETLCLSLARDLVLEDSWAGLRLAYLPLQ